DRGQRLDRGGPLVEVARGGGGLHHRVLAADVVGRDGKVEPLTHGADDVEVGQRRLDHQHVGALGDVELAFAQRLAHVAGVHLVAAPVAERRRAAGDVAERAVERGGELRRVRDDRRLRQLGADRADAAVHHVAGADGVRARLGVRHGGARDQLERGVVVDLAACEDAAVPVRGVLAEADVGEQEELREARPERPERPLDDAVVDPGARALVVLRLRDAEEHHRLDAEADELLALAHDRLDGVAAESGQLRVRQRLRRDEQRQHEVVDGQRRLAHEVAERRRPPQAPQPGRRERHPRNGRTAARAASANARQSPASQAASRATAPHGWKSKSVAEKSRTPCANGSASLTQPAAVNTSAGISPRNTIGSTTSTATSDAVRASRATAPTSEPTAPSAAPVSASAQTRSGSRLQGSPPGAWPATVATANASATPRPSTAETTAASATLAATSRPGETRPRASRPRTFSSRSPASAPAASTRPRNEIVSASA